MFAHIDYCKYVQEVKWFQQVPATFITGLAYSCRKTTALPSPFLRSRPDLLLEHQFAKRYTFPQHRKQRGYV